MQKNIQKIILEMRRHAGEKVNWRDDPFTVLISTVLSQRTKDQNTTAATERLFSRYKTPQEIAGAPLRELERLVKPSGFYRVKARRIQEISRQIVRDFGGTVPRKREDLLSLSGVGPKTAGCVQVYAFGDDALPVDTHVHRISNRLGLVKTKAPEKTEPELKKAIPRKYWREINLLMVSFGQKVCLPRNPRCGICGLKKICRYYTFYPKEHSYDADNAHGNGQPARCLWKNYTASCALSQNQQLKVALHETSKNCLANEAVISKVCSCCTRLHQNVS